MAAGEVHARHDHRRAAVGRGADVEQPERVGDDRAREHVVGRVLLAEARVRVLEPVARVLHLDLREVVAGGAVEVHAATRVQREVRGVGGAEHVEAQPVGVVGALAADGGEEALGRGVGTDDERDVAEAGEDLRPRVVQRVRARRAGRVARRHAHARPAELLRERRPGDEARVAVADGVGAGDVLDVVPREPGVGRAPRAPRPCRTR